MHSMQRYLESGLERARYEAIGRPSTEERYSSGIARLLDGVPINRLRRRKYLGTLVSNSVFDQSSGFMRTGGQETLQDYDICS